MIYVQPKFYRPLQLPKYFFEGAEVVLSISLPVVGLDNDCGRVIFCGAAPLALQHVADWHCLRLGAKPFR